MSRTLQYFVPPTEPVFLGSLPSAGHYVLEALNLGDMFQQTTVSSVSQDGFVLSAGDPAVTYLRGVLSGLSVDPDGRDHDDTVTELAHLLAEVDRLGAVTIGASA